MTAFLNAVGRTLTQYYIDGNKTSSFKKNLMFDLCYILLCKCAHNIFETTGLSEYLEPVLPKSAIPQKALQNLAYTVLVDEPITTASNTLIAIRVATSPPKEISNSINRIAQIISQRYKFTW